MRNDDRFRQSILAELERLSTVDCHSHTRLQRVYSEEGPFDLFSMTSYFERDMISTGGEGIYKGAKTDEERWQRLKPILDRARNVSY